MISKSQLQTASCCLLMLALLGAVGARQPTKKSVPYAKVAPLIKTKCEYCHNAKSHPEKIDLSSYAALMKSGEHGPIVIAGNPEKSKLIKYVNGEKSPRMPYKLPPLTNSEIELLKAWVKAGAKG